MPISSQNCYDQYIQLKASKEAPKSAEVDELLRCAKDSTQIIEIAHFFSVRYYIKKKYSLAIKYANIEVDHFIETQKSTVSFENALYNLGRFYFVNRQFSEGVRCFENVIAANITQNKVARSYVELGKYYRRKGELYKALDYSKKGIYLLETDSNKDIDSESSLLSSYINTTIIYDALKTKSASLEGIALLAKADSLIQKEKRLLTRTKFYSLNAGYANLYGNRFLNNFEKAKYYYERNLHKGLELKDSMVISNSYVNLGELHLNHKKDSALFFLERSLRFNKNNKIRKAESYRNISNYNMEQGKYELALENIEISLSWSFGQKGEVTNTPPTQLNLYETGDRRDVFKALRSKIIILLNLYETTKDRSYVERVLGTVTISDRLVAMIIENSYEINTKLLWRKEASEVYVLGIRAAHLLKDEVAMFRHMEKNRALLLIQGIKENTLQFNLPKELLDKRLALTKDILSLEDKIHANTNVYSKEKDALFELKEYYRAFNDSLYRVNPQYFDEKLKMESLSLSDVRKALDLNTVIVSYALDENYGEEKSLFGLVISYNHTFSFKVKNTEEVLLNLEQYKQFISKPLKTKKELAFFKEVSFSLYNELFPGEHLKKIIVDKHLVLIPDVGMQNIPFEAFNVNEKSIKYLIEQNDISYTYSMSFLEQTGETERKTDLNFAGFAPIRFSAMGLPVLQNTEDEILSINTVLKGDTYLFEQASKEIFLEKSKNARIIHLATHATSGEKPEVYFFKDTIKLHELYTHKNNADLVVLSACQTNIGKINKGEGVFSLARGFFYSGANAVISSLWNVNDTSTSSVMKYFYEDLEASSSKVKALGNAKRKYLKKHSLSETSPYYWASFVLIGDTTPTFEHNFTPYYIIGFLLITILSFIFFRKKG